MEKGNFLVGFGWGLFGEIEDDLTKNHTLKDIKSLKTDDDDDNDDLQFQRCEREQYTMQRGSAWI